MNKEHSSQMTTEARNDGNTVLSAVPFTYEWWMEVGKKA